MRSLLPKKLFVHVLRVLALNLIVVTAHAADPAALTITSAQSTVTQLSLEEIRKLPARKSKVVDEKGKESDYECVTVAELLAKANISLGKTIRGNRLAEYLLATARDGYRAVFALPELDGEFTDRPVLLCYARDGSPLSAEEGPLRIILPHEKRGARWVRQITALAVKMDKLP